MTVATTTASPEYLAMSPLQKDCIEFSDVHKEALGFRPSAEAYKNFKALTVAERRNKLEELYAISERQMKQDAQAEEAYLHHVLDFY